MLVIREAKPIREPRFEAKDCLGCEDCKGTCREILQMLAVPAAPRGSGARAISHHDKLWKGLPQ